MFHPLRGVAYVSAFLLPAIACQRAEAQWLGNSTIHAPDARLDDQFASALSLSPPFAAVGARGRDDYGRDSGAVYVFRRDANGPWARAAKLFAPEGDTDDMFGHSVAIEGGVLVAGAPGEDDLGSEGGAAHVFARSDGAWTHAAELLPSRSADGLGFGWSVSLSGPSVLVGSRDGSSVFVFTQASGAWAEEAEIPTPGSEGDHFGYAVALAGDVAIVGAPFDSSRGREAGAAYVFERAGDTWTLAAKLLASDGQANDLFGVAVAASGGRIVGAGQRGAYIFERVDGAWTEAAALAPPNGADGLFGSSVALAGDTVVVGASADSDRAPLAGAAHIFQHVDGAWMHVTKLFARDPAEGDQFGWSVAAAGASVLVGTPWDDHIGADAGSVHGWDRCPADFDGDGAADTRDAIAFLDAWSLERDAGCGSGGCSTDFDGNGTVDTRDFVQFLNVWATGC